MSLKEEAKEALYKAETLTGYGGVDDHDAYKVSEALIELANVVEKLTKRLAVLDHEHGWTKALREDPL